MLQVLVPSFSSLSLRRLRAASRAVRLVRCEDDAEAVRRAPTADATIGFVTPEVFRAGRNLRWAQALTAGVEQLLFPELQQSKVVLTNARDVWSAALAEQHLAFMSAFARGMHLLRRRQREERWDSRGIPFSELSGRTLLVVGYGGIGRQTARRARALGMIVEAITRRPRKQPSGVHRLGAPKELRAYLKRADYVAICCPSTPETRGWFDPRAFAAMKRTAFLTNVTRGDIVVTAALVTALAEGRLAGAGLDVVDPEPLPPAHPLWQDERVLLTPHCGGNSSHGSDALVALLEDNVNRFGAGRPLRNVVDKRRGY
jgi:phosphoglycerate dehydrogenase-like enzyme